MEWHPTPETRRRHDSLKWATYPAGELPLWVADMDCAPPPVVHRVLSQALEHGVFGYGREPEGFRAAWVDHLNTRHDWAIDPDWIVPVAGVVPAMRMALMAHPEVTDVVTPTPIYPYFRSIPPLEARRHHPVALTQDNGSSYASLGCDRSAIAQALAACQGASAVLWCNPQNPGGTVYDSAFVRDLIGQAASAQSLLVSDEIWADLRLNATPHCPLGREAPIDQPTITLMAATKTFNVAGFACAVAIIPEPKTRHRFEQLQQAMPHVTPLAAQITEACLREGWAWHAELLDALKTNRNLVLQWASTHPELTLSLGDASFLAWFKTPYLDPDAILAECGVRVSGGRAFGDPRCFRLNFGCSPATLTEAMARMDDGLARLATQGGPND